MLQMMDHTSELIAHDPVQRMRLLRSAMTTRALAIVLFLCSGASFSVAQSTAVVGVEGRSNESVSIAAQQNFVAITWGATATGGMDVYSAVSRNGGSTFGAPVRVNAVAFDARVGGEQPPHVALVPRRDAEPAIVIVWTAKRPEGSRLLTARSDDGGVRFGVTNVVPGTEASGNRGWESITVDAAGGVHVLWLDHRSVPTTPHQHGAIATTGPSAPKADPTARALFSQLYSAALDGRSSAISITGGVCYCCKTAFVAGADGTLYGAWRHVFPGSMRDIALTTSRDAGRTFSAPLRVSEDKWQFDGCPDNGPSLSVDANRRVHAVWPSPADVSNPSVMALFYAVSADGGPFSARVRIPTDGPAGHVQVLAASPRELVVAWEEPTTAGRTVKMARGTSATTGQIVFRRIGATEAGRYPSVANSAAGALVAFAQPRDGRSVIVVRRIAR